jgi:hypothetical protein
LSARGDVALGLVPQAVLGRDGGDAWACFWAAVRRIDDAVEEGGVPSRWQQVLASVAPAGEEMEAALAALPPEAAQAVRARADAAWAGLRARASWARPPSLAAYLSASAAMAGFPMRFFYGLAGVDPASASVFSDLLGVSVQLGDDVRDVAQDAARGLRTVAREELVVVEAGDGEPAARVGMRLAPYRVRLSAWFLAEAMAHRPSPRDVPGSRVLGLPLLWHRALRDGQVVPTTRRLRLPGGGASDVASIRRALASVLASADEEPEAVAGILHQDLVALAEGLDPWASAVAHEVAASLGRR